jgi:hypothetical protein
MHRDMEKENYLTPLVLNFSFEHAIRNIHVSQEVLKLNQHLFFVVDVNVQGENVHSVKNYEA